ncbi:MAG TPA: THUMP domain-containing protein [Polyangiaceae bacterium]|nr:THUMP domain-containing protein [Polyangiaceae bacterium]
MTEGSDIDDEQARRAPEARGDWLRFFATAAKGTEGAVRDELREHRFRAVRASRGGVSFEGPLAEGFRACVVLRTAVRVLLELDQFAAPSEDALYEGARAIEWERWLDEETTLAVRATTRSSVLTHSRYVAQKTKDAVVDRLRDRLGARPSVDLDDPDVTLSVHLAKDEATIYLDLGGKPLHIRGYRDRGGEAPLKETLAASIVLLSGWDRVSPLVDPMCGSGTIAIEAALLAARVAPGIGTSFGFERWRSFGDEERRRYGEVIEAARARRRTTELPDVRATDIDASAVADALRHVSRAGARVAVSRADVADLRSRDPITVVTNPPYGERLGIEEAAERRMGRAFASLRGSRLAILAGAPRVLDAIPLRPAKLLALMNGDIECRLALYSDRGPDGDRAP